MKYVRVKHLKLLLALAIIIGMLLSKNVVLSQVYKNAGFLLLSRSLAGAQSDLERQKLLAQSQSFLSIAATYNPSSTGVYRGWGLADWETGDTDGAITKWRQAGWTAQDAIAFGQDSPEWINALRWYEVAEQLDANDPDLWVRIGKICQKQPQIDAICQRFLARNGGNWFVDPHFTRDLGAWGANRKDGVTYSVDKCPDREGYVCGVVEISRDGIASSLRQCIWLSPGKAYQFSAWLKVQTEGTWRPLYHQGNRSGQPIGKWTGDETGTNDWVYWEKVFVADNFDENQACFHPIHLTSQGRAWFYNAELIEIH